MPSRVMGEDIARKTRARASFTVLTVHGGILISNFLYFKASAGKCQLTLLFVDIGNN